MTIHKNPSFKRYVLAAVYMLWLALTIASCTTQKKVSKYLDNHGFFYAAKCATDFPCDYIVQPGKPIIIRDTFQLPGDTIACPPGATDTIYKPCPPPMVIRDSIIFHDTMTIRDSAQIKALSFYLGILQADSAKKADQIATLRDKSTRRGWWNAILGAVIGCTVSGWVIAKFKIL